MTDSSVTQCPHCRTSFRVSRAQLSAAHGSVRCGACLHVFNATQHLIGEATNKPTPSAPAISSPPVRSPQPTARVVASTAKASEVVAPATNQASKPVEPAAAKSNAADTLWIHDDLDLGDLNLDEELARLEQEEQQFSREFMALQSAPKPAEQLLQQPIETRQKHDESWAERLLDEPRQKAINNIAVTKPEQPKPITPNPAPASSREQPLSTSGDAKETETEAELEVTAAAAEVTDSDPDSDALEEIELAPAPDTTEQNRNQSEHFFHLHDEPMQLAWQAPAKPWGRWITWGLLNLLAAGALVGQYINYRFDDLARQDQYRPWFEQLCPSLGCTLPSKVDINLIKSSNLVVRSHPEFSGALVVDAIIYNRAPFSQPFPLLELRFADINDQPLANRRFKPSEYLGGELAGRREMPPQTPIHVSLDILDPGSQAVNYSLEFESPE